jgi:hypothetical protein
MAAHAADSAGARALHGTTVSPRLSAPMVPTVNMAVVMVMVAIGAEVAVVLVVTPPVGAIVPVVWAVIAVPIVRVTVVRVVVMVMVDAA